jgi:hypothetical protein
VLAILVLMIAMIPVSNLLTNVLTQTGSSRERLSALSYAESVIESLNNNGPPISNNQPNVPSTQAEGSKTLQGISYSASAKFTWSNPGGGSPNLCTSGLVPIINLTVTVTWGASQTVTDTTDLYYPPSGIQTYGYLGVQVSGSSVAPALPANDTAGNTWASRLNAMTVTATPNPQTTPASTYTITPGSNGCAFLALPPANYTAVITQNSTPAFPNAFIANYNEATSQTQGSTGQTPISVNAGVMTPVTFQYDEGALVAIKYPTTTLAEDGAVCPNVGSIQCITTGETAASSTTPNTGSAATMYVQTGTTWAAAGLPTSPTTSVISRVQSIACAGTVSCIAVGFGTTNQGAAVYAKTGSPTTWTAAFPAVGSVATLSQIVCPSATVCLAIGTNTSGTAVILAGAVAAATGAVTWVADTMPAGVTVSSVSQIVCAGTTACFVIGTNSSGTAVILSGTVSNATQQWANASMPAGVTISSLSQIVCGGTTACMAIGLNSSSTAVILSGKVQTATQQWANASMPAGVTISSLSQIVCSGATACLAIGSSSTSTGVILAGKVQTAAQTWINDIMPTGLTVSSVNNILCPGTSCMVTGANSTSALIITGTLSNASQTWKSNTSPSSVLAISQVACPSNTVCLATGNTLSGGVVMSGTLSASGGQTFSLGSPPAGVSPLFYSELVCVSATVCTAPGATSTGAFILNGAFGTSWTWTNGTPSTGFTGGMYANGLAVSVGNSNLLPSSPLVVSAYSSTAADPSQIGPLYPFTSGYSVGAGDCTGDVTNSSAASTIPGGSTSSPNATVVLPLSLLSIQVLHNGVPVSNETVKATVANGSCGNADTYTLEKTGPDGLSRTAVVQETYTVAVTGTYTGSVTVSVSAIGNAVSSVTTPAPTPIQVNV